MSEIALREEFDGPLVGCKVDREAGVLHDALLLGPLSRDGMAYPDATRDAAVPLFKGAKVNLSHTKAEGSRKYGAYAPPPPTPHERRLGKVIDARNTPDGVRGDVKILKSHPFSATLMESAESMPDLFGFSILASGLTDDGGKVCTKINRLNSVDVVTDAATARGLFEEKEEGEEEREATSSEHYDEACRKYTLECLQEFFAGTISAKEAADKIEKHLASYDGMHKKGKQPEEPAEDIEEQIQHLKDEQTKSLALIEEQKKQIDQLKRASVVRTPATTNGAKAGRDPIQILKGEY